jgi:hypothetical protein
MNIPMALSGSTYLKNKTLRTLATTILNFFNPKLTEDQENYLTLNRLKTRFIKKLHWLLESAGLDFYLTRLENPCFSCNFAGKYTILYLWIFLL